MTTYYNEIDPYAAQWLRNLIDAGFIAKGDVDERSIEDVKPDELMGYTQCHFFAGIGGWSYALRLAGWPDDKPVWTGSCPCQPFSSAGKRKGTADERHLWPAWFHLIEQCRPDVVFGEQVASPDGLMWLDLVQSDMDGAGYAVGAADLCAAGAGAPHIRQRLWFVAHAEGGGSRPGLRGNRQAGSWGSVITDSSAVCKLDNTISEGLERHCGHDGQAQGWAEPVRPIAEASSFNGRVSKCDRPYTTNGFWRNADWLFCRDGKWRAVEPGTSPLAHRVTSRMGRLRAYGNAIVPQVAAEVIKAYTEHLFHMKPELKERNK